YSGPHYLICFLECLRLHGDSFEEFEFDRHACYGDGPSCFPSDGVLGLLCNTTGAYVIDSAFSAAATLFMKFEVLREDAISAKSLEQWAVAQRSIADIKGAISQALDQLTYPENEPCQLRDFGSKLEPVLRLAKELLKTQ